MSGLEQDFPGQVRAQNVDATTPEAKTMVKGLGFKNHGLMVRSADGKLLHKQPDHSVDVDAARKAIAEILNPKN